MIRKIRKLKVRVSPDSRIYLQILKSKMRLQPKEEVSIHTAFDS